jgi:hypothetical protein
VEPQFRMRNSCTPCSALRHPKESVRGSCENLENWRFCSRRGGFQVSFWCCYAGIGGLARILTVLATYLYVKPSYTVVQGGTGKHPVRGFGGQSSRYVAVRSRRTAGILLYTVEQRSTLSTESAAELLQNCYRSVAAYLSVQCQGGASTVKTGFGEVSTLSAHVFRSLATRCACSVHWLPPCLHSHPGVTRNPGGDRTAVTRVRWLPVLAAAHPALPRFHGCTHVHGGIGGDTATQTATGMLVDSLR